MINYDKVWKYIQAPADFKRDGNREGIKEIKLEISMIHCHS